MIDLAAPYVLNGRAVSAHKINRNTAMASARKAKVLRARQRAKRKRKVPIVKTFDDMQKAGNANVDATMHSFEGVTKASQAIATEIADYSKRSFENGTKTMENLLGAKSLDKAFEVQSEYARAAYEDYVAYAGKLGQLYTDLAQEVVKPYQSFVANVTPRK
jgi:hypothetical protein